MSKQLTANELALNLDETNIMKFGTIILNTMHYELSTIKKKHIEDNVNTKLLGLQTQNHIIKQLPTSQAEKYTCQHQHTVHFTMKTTNHEESEGSI